ncbi:Cytochrome P450 2L1 [Armadillidium nasatum]|uniref:Cytochrome P450 2L1 n=1 Tax=Armadillidium nasatum TaxID=96803 RepID=A0A5N5T5I2_9CRUS|nr:Cytochrome P450 2L1 [Armadillidium nasatum]
MTNLFWRIGSTYVVAILDYQIYKEAYQHQNIAFRPKQNALTFVQGKSVLGIVNTGGERWIQNRRFALRHLRDFGMGKEKLLFDAHYEADNFVSDLKNKVGKPTSIPPTLLISILNTAWQMIASTRYEFDDKEIIEFVKLVSETHICGPKLIILDLFPWLKKILPSYVRDFLFKHKVQKELSDKIKAYFEKHIYNHMKDVNEENIRDYIDAYLIEMEKQKSNSNSGMSIEDLTFCLSDLFEGSTETTSLSIHWAILYLSKYPNVQKKLQAEIDEFLPKGVQFLMKDKTKLPYTEAFIAEILRLSSVVSIPPRAAEEDTKIGPYFIPKGSWVLGESFVVHRDPKYWDSPDELRPERFLDSNGKFVAPSKGFVPFGYGK